MRTVALLSALLLTACSTAPIEHTRYLMRADAPESTERASADARVGIRHLRVAPYLDEAGLVLETAPNVVRRARFHEWAEPLDDGLRSLLRSELSSRLDQDVDDDPLRASHWTWVVDVAIDRFHGTRSGDALLVASWRVDRTGSDSGGSRHEFSQQQALSQPGYAALVEAQLALARALAGAIAESLAGAR
jgi:hypothetical protein